MMHGETHGGEWVVPSRMVLENGAIGFACMIFFVPAVTAASTEHGFEPQRTRATALAKRGWHRIPTVMGSERVKVWWLVWLHKGMTWPG